jgi:hypothetical protein
MPTTTVGKPGATVFDPGSLADRLRSPRDPRHRRGIRYSLDAVLPRVAAGAKDNETSVAPALFQSLDPRGKVVMGDAIHTQRALSVQIRAASPPTRHDFRKAKPCSLDALL